MTIIIVLSSFLFIYSSVQIYKNPLLKEVMIKNEFFRFTTQRSTAVVLPVPKEKPDYYPPVETLNWKIDTIGRIFGILSLLTLILLFYGFLRQLLQTKELKDNSKIQLLSSQSINRSFSMDDFTLLSGSDLLRAGYENFRIFFGKDFDLTPWEFLTKYSNETLSEITKEYIKTEYGMKPTKVSDDVIRKWIGNLELFLKQPILAVPAPEADDKHAH